MASSLVPVVSSNSLAIYLRDIAKFPMLSVEEEYELARRYHENGDIVAAQKLTTSHLRLAAKVALSYRHYGLPIVDLISEANIGLMQAIKKFDPAKGFRLSTYAIWWIKAAISDFILRSWSLVKIGTVSAQKRLFYNLSKIKARLGLYQTTALDCEHVEQIAHQLNVQPKEVLEMDQRLNGDTSLNEIVYEDSSIEKQALLVDQRPSAEEVYVEKQIKQIRNNQLKIALDTLTEREREIITQRYLSENVPTLEDLALRFGVSRERIRQIENKALEKIKKLMLNG